MKMSREMKIFRQDIFIYKWSPVTNLTSPMLATQHFYLEMKLVINPPSETCL